MSMFNGIDWTKRGNSERCISNSEKLRLTPRNSREDTRHSSALETRRSGMELSVTHLKENVLPSPHRWWNDSTKQVHPVLKSISALGRGILTRKNNRDTIHFNADASNTELLCRAIHSANQISIYGAVSRWCKEFGQKPNEKKSTSQRFVAKENEQRLKNVKPQEANSLVQTPRSDDPASGNRLRECLQNLGTLEKSIQFSEVCGNASFWKRVSTGKVLQIHSWRR